MALEFDCYVELGASPQNFKKQYIETSLSDSINIEVVSELDKGARIKVPKV